MKTITIGRGDGCDIHIDHNKISRRHAILKVYTFGKMEIVDMGQNGTWVNGVKLRPGVPFPVKRKDVVNFAEVSQLNWSLVPNPTKYLKLASVFVFLLLLLIVVLILAISKCPGDSSDIGNSYLPSESMENTIEGNVSNDSHSVDSKEKENSQETGSENEEEDMVVLPNNKSRTKTAEELFPFVNNKKNDSVKKESENKKEKEKEKKPKDNKSEKNSKKVHVII